MKRSSRGKLQDNTSRTASTSRMASPSRIASTSRMGSRSRIASTSRMASNSTMASNSHSSASTSTMARPPRMETPSKILSSTRSQSAEDHKIKVIIKSEDVLLTDCVYIESQKGRFSWQSFEGHQVPCIIRVMNGEHVKFVSVRMAEKQLLKNYLLYLHAEIFSCTCIKSFLVTDHEARLLNEINQHSDYLYGKYTFDAGKDLIVTLEDVQECYTFMDVCFQKLQCKITPGHNDKCGFIRINSESTVPYCMKDGKQYAPMFYFEGVTKSFMSLAVQLENWELAYLKFCCMVQGINPQFYNNDSCKSIDFEFIKKCYSPESSFQEYWPLKLIDTHLLINQSSNHANPSGVWVRAPLEVVHDESTLPTTLIEPAPPITQSIPKNTYQTGWPANILVDSYTIQPKTQPQPPSTVLKYCVGTSNENVAPQNTGLPTWHTPVASSSTSSSGGATSSQAPTTSWYLAPQANGNYILKAGTSQSQSPQLLHPSHPLMQNTYQSQSNWPQPPPPHPPYM